ncbi:MAG: carboxypeptidase regulatory-like domain-containing protein, partial [Blastocatellia bacterium]|nr:carboxypeptidase regulatory-like domain-containing protein [Blastocatellia bacterium]
MRNKIGVCLCVLLTAVFTAVGVSAQVGSQGQISGFVHDSSGAAISGATVVVTNTGTKQQRTAQTDAEGYYVVTNIPPAIYDVSVEQSGFSKFVQTGVKLDAAGKETVDIVLQVGNVTETVTVQASGAQLQESTATVG